MSTFLKIILDCSSPEFQIILFFDFIKMSTFYFIKMSTFQFFHNVDFCLSKCRHFLSKCRHFNENAEKLLFHLVVRECGQGKRSGSFQIKFSPFGGMNSESEFQYRDN